MSHDHDDRYAAAPIIRIFGLVIGINLLLIAVENFYGLKVEDGTGGVTIVSVAVTREP